METKNEFIMLNGLTRYLYLYVQVFISLFCALLERNRDEALFWIYELFYSGFQQEVFDFILEIYVLIYKTENAGNPKVDKFVNDIVDKWTKNNQNNENNQSNQSNDCLIGSLVSTFIGLKYDLTHFVLKYLKVKCADVKPKSNPKPNPKPQKITIIIHIKDADIDKYRTNETEHLHVLCRFPLRNNMIQLMELTKFIPKYDVFNTNWLYYAYQTPIWRERILEYNGAENLSEQTVVFRTPAEEEDFHNRWNYEPDELPMEVKRKLMGFYDTINTKQMSVSEFCETYNIQMVKITIIKKTTTKL